MKVNILNWRSNGIATFSGSLKRQRQPISVFADTDGIERLESIAVVPDCQWRDIRFICELIL